MPLFDLPLEALREYRATHEAPADFDDFWATTLRESRALAFPTRVEPVDNGLALVETADVTFAGFGGDPVRAWWHRPADTEPVAVVVEFMGYSGGRGLAHQQGEWPLAGCAHLLVDSRGQGWAQTRPGATTDPHGTGSAVPGQMTRGIEDPETYYYRRLYTDAALALDVARGLADGVPLFVAGGSQGGGLTIAAAALDRIGGGAAAGIAGAMPDVPFLCDFPRATTITGAHPYSELVTYLATFRDRVEQVFRTLSYFDGVHLAARAEAPALFSVALMDQVCPPSTVFAAFNAWASDEKSIEVYPFNGHEGGGVYQRAKQLDWLRNRIA